MTEGTNVVCVYSRNKDTRIILTDMRS